MVVRYLYRCLTLVVLALSLVLPADSQSVQGDLTGTVTDASGGIVPGAKVTVVNESNGGTRSLVTDNSGNFLAIGFFVGNYRVEFEKDGFRKLVVPDVKVEPATLRRVDAVMAVGSVADTVNVTAAAPVVQSEGTTINYGLPRAALDRKLSDNTRSGWAMDVIMWAPGSAGGRGGLFLFGG